MSFEFYSRSDSAPLSSASARVLVVPRFSAIPSALDSELPGCCCCL